MQRRGCYYARSRVGSTKTILILGAFLFISLFKSGISFAENNDSLLGQCNRGYGKLHHVVGPAKAADSRLEALSFLEKPPLTPMFLDFHDAKLLSRAGVPVLGLIGFANKAEASPVTDTEVPLATVGMPSVDGVPHFQAWPASGEVTRGEWKGVQYSADGLHMMGVVTVDSSKSVTQGTYEAYGKILALIKKQGYGRLARAWNFVPEILDTEPGSGTQRYKAFCDGRNQAYTEHGLEKQDYSAATGIGPRGGEINIMFIASRGHSSMTNLENPLQVSAFNYPGQYRKRASPSFARATFERRPNGDYVLYISGTASIRDTENVHEGDVARQTEVTLENIEALIAKNNLEQHDITNAPNLTLADVNSATVYVKNVADMPVVESICARILPNAEITVVEATVCRGGLLVEIEGMVTGRN